MKYMTKNTKKNLVKALFILTLSALGTGLFAWEGAGDLTMTGSGNTVVDHPPVLAHDGRPQTYAAFRPGTDGWLKVSLNQDSLIRGVRINGFVPATVWGAVGYEQEGMLKMFPSGYFRDRTGEFVIDVAKSEIISDELFLIFHGEELDQVMIHEVEVRSQPRDEVYYSKPLRVREAGENTSYHTSEFQINDGYPGTYWAVRAPEEWGRIHWHVQQDLRDRYPYNRSRTGWKEGFIELETVTPAPAELLKLYVADKGHGEMTIKVKAAGTWRTVDTVSLDLKKGWLSYALDATWGEIQGIRLDVKGQKKEFGGIGEVELWGTGDYQGLTHEDLLPANYGDGKEEAGFFEIPPGSEGEIYTLTAVFREREAEESGLSLNGTEIAPTRIVEQDQVFLFEYDLKANQLWEGENFFGVTASASNQFLSVHLTKQVRDGKLRRLSGIPGDGRILNGTFGQEEGEIVLDGEYELLRVKVYYQGSSPGRVYQKIQGPEMQGAGAQYGMMFLSPGEMGAEGPQEGRGWWDWSRRRRPRPRPPRPNPPTPEPPSYDPVYLDVLEQGEGYVLYQGRGAADTLGFSGGSGITEIELIGSRSEKSVPMVRMINPSPYRSYQENEIWYKTAFGVTDTPAAEIRINGKKAKVSGNIFWAELRHLGLRQYGLQDITAEITDSEGRTSSYTIPVIIQSDRYWIELEQQEMLTYTRDESFQVSGRANQWTNNLYINDSHVPISRNRFSREVPLKEGLNLIEIRFTDRWTNRVVAYYIRKVYKVSGEILVDIKNPVDGIFVNEPETHVSGFARGAGLRSVTVNGIGTRIQGSSFCTLEPIPLLQEENPITVTAVDKTGYETTKTITVYRDITPPEISGVEPVNGTWFSYKDVTFSGVATDDNTCSVFVNGHMAMRSGDNFLVSVPLEEGVNTVAVTAVDLGGNTTQYPPFAVKVDTTGPETLYVSADPAGWTNQRPQIFFDGEDNGIGISHFELSANGRAFIGPVSSPFTLAFLPEGENSISVKAVDMLGNARVEDVPVFIDTTAPEGPQNFRAIPGPDSMEVRWTEKNEEVTGYLLTLPGGEEVSISRDEGTALEGAEPEGDLWEFSWREEDLSSGQTREYELQSRDRAGNLSEPVELVATVALAEVEHVEEEPTVIEYENLMVALPADSVPEGIVSIKMEELVSQELEELSPSPLVSPIYSFYAETESGEIQNSVSFTEPFVGVIEYSEEDLPEGYTEDSLQVYYFDTLWGTWFAIEDSYVDTESNTVLFQTDHFTEFAVQPTPMADLSVEELTSMEFSNFTGTVSHDPVSVSPQNGSMSTSMIDLFLPGKNGFDFAIRRIYNTSLAKDHGRFNFRNPRSNRRDIGQFQPSLSFGQGWKLDLPHLKYTKNGIYLAVPGGSYYDISSMGVINEVEKKNGLYRVVYENHDGQDFTFVTKRESHRYYDSRRSRYSHYYTIKSSTLYLKDGTSYHFNDRGLVRKIEDPTGAMSVTVDYTDDFLIDYITDSLGRIIRFTYGQETSGSNIIHYPHITSIQVDGSARELSYSYEKDINNVTDIGELIDFTKLEGHYFSNPSLKIPLLTGMSESPHRAWTYSYDDTLIAYTDIERIAGSMIPPNTPVFVRDRMNGLYTLSQHAECMFLLQSASGPGLGTEFLDYDVMKVTYEEKKRKDDGDYFTRTITLDKFPVVKEHTHSFTPRHGTAVSHSEAYGYNFVVYDHDKKKEYYNQHTLINNGKLLTSYKYEKAEKESSSFYINTGMGDDIYGYQLRPLASKSYYVPINTKIIRRDAQVVVPASDDESDEEEEEKNFLELIRYEYDENQRVITERFEKGPEHYTESHYSYDGWSNYTKISYKEVNGIQSLTTETTNLFTPPEGSSINLENPYIYNLLYRSEVIAAVHESNGYWDTTTQLPREETLYSYNVHGQRVSTREYLGGDEWAETRYTYYPLQFSQSGGLSTVTSPIGHQTSFHYVYSPGMDYSIIQQELNLQKADGTTPYSFDTLKTYHFATGNLISYTDGEGFTTTYTYDALGRKLSETRPKSSEEEQVKITIAYDDVNLTTTHTDAMGAVTKYYFDLKGQLEAIEKINREKPNSNSVTSLAYDGYGNISSIADPRSNFIGYGYDALDRLISETYINGQNRTEFHQKTHSYDDEKNSRITLRENGSTIYEAYDMAGNVIQRIDGRSFEYAYDHNGNLLSFKQTGAATLYSYDHRGLLKTETLPSVPDGYDGNNTFSRSSLKKVYTYDAAGNRTFVTSYRSTATEDTEVSTVQNKHDGLGQVLQKTYSYTQDGNSMTTAVQYAYDREGRVTAVTDGNGIQVATSYTPRGQVASETDGQGFVTTYEYDLEDRLVKMTDPRGQSGDYDGDFAIEYEYDDLDRLVEGTLPLRPGETEKPVVLLEYDARGNLTKRTEPDSSYTEYAYNFRNWVKSETRYGEGNLSYETTYEYDKAGNRIEVKEPAGAIWAYAYDGADRLIREQQPDGAVIKYDYDGRDNITARTNGNGFWSYFSYDARDNLVVATDAKGYKTHYDYDIRGNRTRMTDPNNNSWTYRYDELGRMVEEENSRGDLASYAYDKGGRLQTLIDPNGTTVTYSYNRRNLPESVSYTNPKGLSQRETFSYDEAGSVKTASLDGVVKRYNHFQNESGEWIYRPDPYGMVFAEDLSFEGHDYRTQYDFNRMNRLTGMTYSQGLSYTQQWNNLGQLQSISGYASGFVYDTNGRMDEYSQANGVVVDYEYDVKSRLKILDYSSGGTSLWNYSYAYDLSDNMVTRNEDYFGYGRTDQLVTTILQGLSSETEFKVNNFELMNKELDVLGQEKSFEVAGEVSLDYGASSLVVDYSYPYRMKRAILRPENKDHRLEEDKLVVYTAMYNEEGYFTEQPDARVLIREDTGELTIEFDQPVFARFLKIHCHFNELDREGSPLASFATFRFSGESQVEAWAMVSGRNEFYNYDGKGNRRARYLMLERDYPTTYQRQTDSDLLKSDGTYGYVYDKNGNMITKGTVFDDSYAGYVKHPEDVAVKDPQTFEYYEYVYDLKNRLRSVKKYDPVSDSVEEVARYLYDIDGYRIKKENREGITHFVFDTSGKVLEEIDMDSGDVVSSVFLKNRHLARVSGDETLFYGTDHLGTTIIMTDEAGDLVWTGEATPFGDAVVRKTGDRTDLGLKYTGKDLDEDTGLYYFNARWYDAETGRFISEDPARDGANWYVYVTNNPLKYIDPTGLRQIEGSQENGDEDYSSSRKPKNDDDDDKGGADKDDIPGLLTVPEGPLKIDYYDDAGGEIILNYENQDQFVGEDLDFGSLVPVDSNISVPEGSELVLVDANGNKYTITGAETNIPDTIEDYNDMVKTDAYQEALKDQKINGYINLGIGGAEIGTGLYIGSKGLTQPGAALVSDGLRRIPFALSDISKANRGILNQRPTYVQILAEPTKYNWY